jgi:hypothetical protein
MRVSGARSPTFSPGCNVSNGRPATARLTPHCWASFQTGEGLGLMNSAIWSMI